MSIKNPFRITIERYGKNASIEFDHSDITLDEYADALIGVSRAAGWTDKQLEEIGLVE